MDREKYPQGVQEPLLRNSPAVLVKTASKPGTSKSDGSYQFAPWLRENDGSLSTSNYCGDNYIGAKENFAILADFVPSDHLFTNEQLVEALPVCAGYVGYVG